MTTPFQEILSFWFDSLDAPDSTIAGRQAELWWGKSSETDSEIQRRFGDLPEQVEVGALDEWRKSPEGWLALILVVDQFTRNVFRDTPRAFAFDEVARQLCIDGIEAGQDAHLRLIQRVFFYLPLEHSENADHQTWCVDLMRGLVRQAPEDQRAVFENFVGYAEAHKRIIDRFGRFPHRNEILGRASSAEELEFLKQPGSSF